MAANYATAMLPSGVLLVMEVMEVTKVIHVM
jgi:hypothetical protein